MANEELIKTLDALHQQLAESPQLDEETAQALQGLLLQIQTACANNAISSKNVQSSLTSSPDHLSLNERLREMITGFESRHPSLTITLSQIADRLSDMGI